MQLCDSYKIISFDGNFKTDPREYLNKSNLNSLNFICKISQPKAGVEIASYDSSIPEKNRYGEEFSILRNAECNI